MVVFDMVCTEIEKPTSVENNLHIDYTRFYKASPRFICLPPDFSSEFKERLRVDLLDLDLAIDVSCARLLLGKLGKVLRGTEGRGCGRGDRAAFRGRSGRRLSRPQQDLLRDAVNVNGLGSWEGQSTGTVIAFVMAERHVGVI